jgi:hypothetical protein
MIAATFKRSTVVMVRFLFFVLVERHRVVAPTPARPWAAAVPAL